MLTAQRLEHEEKANASLTQQIEPLKAENDSINEALTHARIELGKLYTQLDAEREQWSKESELLKEQRAKEDELRREHFEQQLKTIQEQFQNLASKLLVQTSENLRTQNSEAMKLLTDPLKQDIEQLHQAIRLTNNETAKNTASLSQQLREMSEQTSRINTTATRLTNVIRGGNKEQGNWGERMLTEILDMQGLRRGVDYDIQQTITDANGHAIANDENGLFYIVGWIPIDELKQILPKLSKEKDIKFVIKNYDEVASVPPTNLKNNRIVKPFETLVKMYGLPNYSELDPTLFVAITAFLLFGFMFGDVGHGLVIFIIGLIMSKKKAGLGPVFEAGGIASIIFGILYGSIFGKEDIIPAILIRPMENIQTMLIYGIIIGVILILISMILNIVIKYGIKTNNKKKIFFDTNGIAGLLFYILILSSAIYYFVKGKMIISIRNIEHIAYYSITSNNV